MRKITVTGNETIRIGRTGENRAVQVIWPGLLEKWRELYGDGTVQLAARRPKDTAPYPVVCEVRENDVMWTVQAADTAQYGIGECELTYLAGEVVAKSQTWATEIFRGLTHEETTEPSDDPAKTWFTGIRKEIGNLGELKTDEKSNLVAAINEVLQSSVGIGISDHAKLENRDAADQHPMSAITGLVEALEDKQPAGDYLTQDNLRGIRTETIVDAINFPQSMKVKEGTVVIDDRFVVTTGSYGMAYADHAPKLKCYCSKSGSYTMSLTVNGDKQNVTLEYSAYNEFNLVFSDGDGSRKIIFTDGDTSIGAFSELSDGDIIEVKVSYASECTGASALTSDNLKNYDGISSVTYDLENIFSIGEQRQYVNDICSTIGTIDRITATSLGLTSDKTFFRIRPSRTSLCATSDNTTAPHHKIYELGTLPNGLKLIYEACESSTIPLTNVNDIIVFTWGETPGTFEIKSSKSYLSKAHTLVKNFDSFKANTTYVIWVRSSVVFAFEAQTGELTIS